MKYFVALVLSLGLSSMAQADRGEGPCAKDRETLCGNVEPGGGAVMKCMKANEEKLSAECKAHRTATKEVMKDVHEACQADAEKFCSDVKVGKGRVVKCLKKHKDQLSEECKSEVASMKKHFRKNK